MRLRPRSLKNRQEGVDSSPTVCQTLGMEISEDLIEQIRDSLAKHKRWRHWLDPRDPATERFPRCQECGHYWPCDEAELLQELEMCKR